MSVRTEACQWPTLRGHAPGLLLAGLAVAHPWFENTMARHMGLELPGLFVIGWLAGSVVGDRLDRASDHWNSNGLPGLLFALCVTGFWMVPTALDLAVLHDAVAIAKVASLVAAGLITRASWSSACMVVQAFFVLNWFWMTLAVGLLYQESHQQLCSVYLAEQQGHAGKAIVIWSAIGLGAWLVHVARVSRLIDDSETRLT
jgi:hypothetical protein